MWFNYCYVSNLICILLCVVILCGIYNYVNLVQILDNNIVIWLFNVVKQFWLYGGYQIVIVGKWYFGEGEVYQFSGFDYWDILFGQGYYYDFEFIGLVGVYFEKGYVIDIIIDKVIDFIFKCDKKLLFFVMCYYKVFYRSWECYLDYKNFYQDDIKIFQIFNDDYKN